MMNMGLALFLVLINLCINVRSAQYMQALQHKAVRRFVVTPERRNRAFSMLSKLG